MSSEEGNVDKAAGNSEEMKAHAMKSTAECLLSVTEFFSRAQAPLAFLIVVDAETGTCSVASSFNDVDMMKDAIRLAVEKVEKHLGDNGASPALEEDASES